MGSFIMTMEATKHVTISLVLPMVGLLLRSLDMSRPILCFDYEDMSKPPTKEVVKASTNYELLNMSTLQYHHALNLHLL
jgi:hypothetical protein